MTDDLLPDGRPEPPLPDDGNVIQIKDHVKAGVAYGSIRVYSEIDAQSAPPRDYYLKGLFSPNELSVIYGEPGCGKSFWILRLARAIAQGCSILGRRVHQTNVLFAALEGTSGFEKRLRADILANQECENFYYIAQSVNLFNDHKAVNDCITAIQSTGAGVFVIDTLNRAMPGGNENAPDDMSQFIRNLDAIRAATSAHIIVIHHSGKDTTKGMRGHSALLGAVDVAIEVSKGEGKSKMASVRKAKDDADGDVFAFQLDVLQLGQDADGDDITTCIVVETTADGTPVKRVSMTPRETLWLDTLKEFFARPDATQMVAPERGMQPVAVATRDQIREWIKVRGLVGVAHSVASSGVLSGTDRSKFARVLEGLKIKGKIGIHGNWIWIV